MRMGWVCVLLFSLNLSAHAQNKARVYGYVKEAGSGELLGYATVAVAGTNTGTFASDAGYYSLALPKGGYTLRVSFAGYEPLQKEITLRQDTLITFALAPLTLNEVEVVDSKIPLYQQSILGFQRLTAQKIQNTSSFLGEPDVMRALTVVPGFSLGREGFGNIYVRGGDRGQNLVLLDGAPVYNTNHAGGMVGAINGRVIKDLEVYKGGFPARFGGRASSVIDIRTRDGNKEAHEASAYVGLVNSGFLVEGPLDSLGKSSYLVAARSSYLDLLLLPLRFQFQNDGQGAYVGLTFLDVNGKVTYQASDKSRLYVTGYTGHDVYKAVDVWVNTAPYEKVASVTEFGINQSLFTVGHQWVPKPNLFFDHRGSWSRYTTATSDRFSVTGVLNNTINNLSVRSLVRSLTYRGTLTVDMNAQHATEIGVEGIRYDHDPGRIRLRQQLASDTPIIDSIIATQASTVGYQLDGFLEHSWKPSPALTAVGGIRFSSFYYGSGSYFNWEPRVSGSLLLGERTSVKANYSRMVQYMHVLIDNAIGPEREVWVMANEDTPPQMANQWSAGIFHSWPNLEIGLEGYYKQLDNLVFIAPIKNVSELNEWSQQIVRNGQGTAYGAELYGEYQSGPWQVTLGYTLSRSFRRFQELNNGEEFPHRFDRPHNLFATTQWNLDADRTLSANFTYQSGAPYTLPMGYSSPTALLPGYYASGGINNVRLPVYHRLDLSYRKEKVKKGRRRYWSINLYNAYARQNAAALVWRGNQLFQTTSFLIVPSFQWGITF